MQALAVDEQAWHKRLLYALWLRRNQRQAHGGDLFECAPGSHGRLLECQNTMPLTFQMKIGQLFYNNTIETRATATAVLCRQRLQHFDRLMHVHCHWCPEPCPTPAPTQPRAPAPHEAQRIKSSSGSGATAYLYYKIVPVPQLAYCSCQTRVLAPFTSQRLRMGTRRPLTF